MEGGERYYRKETYLKESSPRKSVGGMLDIQIE
jgi:hypothetical protein